MTGIVFAAIAPHSELAIPEAVTPDASATAAATQAGMAELARQFAAARPDAIVLLTPHGIHVGGHFGIVTSARVSGSLDETPSPIVLDCPVDPELAHGIVAAMDQAVLPVVSLGFGGNLPSEAEVPMDWGTLVPLWYMGGRADPPVPVVVVSPARELGGQAHIDAGAAIAVAANASGKRIALIASADQGHTHASDGPYGFHEAAGIYDARVCDAVDRNELGDLLDVGTGLIEHAKPDSWWQLLMLHGALGRSYEAHLVSYETPTYYGLLCAAFTPRPAQ